MYKLVLSTLAFCALSVLANPLEVIDPVPDKNSEKIDLVVMTSPVFPHPPAHLFCDPVGLHFRNATEICKLLKNVDSNFEGLAPVECKDPGVPVEIWMHGLLNGEEVHFEKRFHDFCHAKKHLGLLAEGLLPLPSTLPH
ncbi:hypothetical protein A0J61_05149 [Choanephora cucurbitarum]|uniref:Subtilisin inhibitor domain-containing protein n=1 Tax=Choanephora cucurbitarum TaxID=101091 RepID=A0A1C7NCP9_9FUNG|nr:hypothetical protein A0J61_05149 [Choanephora cucurbitarum]